MHAVAVRFELFVPESRSLKTKRAAIRPIVDGLRHRLHVSVTEVDHQDTWQRSAIAVALVGMLQPEFQEAVTGEAEVREVFSLPRIGKVAGCYVRSGVITRGSRVRFLRDGVVIWNGTINSLKRFKDDAREVATGFECGIGLSDFQDLKQGDVIETYELKEIARTGS